MKPVAASPWVSEHLKGVRLYRDDLDVVVGLLRQAGLRVRLLDEAFEYESLDEVAKRVGDSPKRLEIEGRNPEEHSSLTVRFVHGLWFVWATEASHHGIANDILHVLRSRQTIVNALPVHWIFQAGLGLLWVGALLLRPAPLVGQIIVTLGSATALLGTMLAAYWWLFPRVRLRYRHEAGFLKRNRDQLLILVIGALVGAAISWLFSKFS